MPEIHEYRCDGPNCEVRRPMASVTGNSFADAISALAAFGQRSGWTLANIDNRKLGFHTWDCLVDWVVKNEKPAPLVDTDALAEAVNRRANGGSE